MRLVLASQSPRRKELLEYFSYPFEIRPSHYDEEAHPWRGSPEEYVCELSEAKAKAVPLGDDEVILSADTIVFCEGKLYGKPSNLAEAHRYLRELSGRWHSVYTGVTLRTPYLLHSQCEETRVRFHSLSDEQLEAYTAAIRWQDKAGGYAAQGRGGIIIKEIEGCFYNVVGLPLSLVIEMLQQVGIFLWRYLKPEVKVSSCFLGE